MPEGNTPPTSGSSKKMLYIIGGIVLLLILGWLVTRGLGGAMMGASGANMDRNMDGSTTYTDNQGNSATVGGSSMPENWPSDAPQNYAGASIQYSGNSNPKTGEAGAAVVYTTRASVADVVAYYKTQLASSGWTVVGSANMGGATVVSATKAEQSFGVYIVDSGNGMVSVTAGVGMK